MKIVLLKTITIITLSFCFAFIFAGFHLITDQTKNNLQISGKLYKNFFEYKLSEILKGIYPNYNYLYYYVEPDNKVILPKAILTTKDKVMLIEALNFSSIRAVVDEKNRTIKIGKIFSLEENLQKIYPTYNIHFLGIDPNVKITFMKNIDSEENKKNFLKWLKNRNILVSIDSNSNTIRVERLISLREMLADKYSKYKIISSDANIAIGYEGYLLFKKDLPSFLNWFRDRYHRLIKVNSKAKTIYIVRENFFLMKEGSLHENISRFAQDFDYKLRWNFVDKNREKLDYLWLGDEEFYDENPMKILEDIIKNYPLMVSVWQGNRVITVSSYLGE